MQDDISAIHDAFKKVIKEGRPMLNREIATGEYWLASDAKRRGL
ncbi:MAG: hypothetical protein CM1200mP30_28400 [Pseudomonadota bacterium]|nr:MAG: hypothetical protein CM1200mP30_28400 [Pseudomonadota bacterium]